MADQVYWKDAAAKEALRAQGRAVYVQIRSDVGHHDGVVAIDPQSKTHFWGKTLGEANRLAYDAFPDQWLYFCRLDDPSAEIVLPTW